jgi:threonyl-tRNA synthetase
VVPTCKARGDVCGVCGVADADGRVAYRPLWLSPRQFLVVAVAVEKSVHDYCLSIQQQLHELGFYVDVDLTDATLPKKMKMLREKPLYNYALVIGNKEAAAGEVNVRDRESNVLGTKPLNEFIAEVQQKIANFE